MKLEKLKGSKFEAFKENEIQNAFKVVGGDQDTTYHNGSAHGTDTYRVGTTDTGNFNWNTGEPIDYERKSGESTTSGSGSYTNEGDITKSPGFDPNLLVGVGFVNG